jgi:NNP family nitrate/nitrite transporter-like MFS transporter
MFGLTNIFARSLGGYLSDVVGPRFGIVGRLWCQFWFMLIQSLFMIGFSAMTYETFDIGSALALFTMWAILLSMANGSAFGICPFIEPCGKFHT